MAQVGILGTPHTVIRSQIFESVMALYRTEWTILNEYPLCIMFDKERAIDLGGVSRDMFTAFFDEAYKELFDGCTLLIPALHPNIDFSSLPIFGAIMSHSYLVSGVLPIRVAFPTLAQCLLGAIEISDDILFSSFIDSLSIHDAAVLKSTFNEANAHATSFKMETSAGLLELASRFGCRRIPTPVTLKGMFLQIAKYEFILKPAAAIAAINSGIPDNHASFWKGLGVQGIFRVYKAKSVSPAKVLEMLGEVHTLDPNQERIVMYLKQYIGSLNSEDLQRFLRFVTGTSCISSKIEVMFNTLTGAARRPIAHTCQPSIELSLTYSTYVEFARELRSVVGASDDSLWGMHAL